MILTSLLRPSSLQPTSSAVSSSSTSSLWTHIWDPFRSPSAEWSWTSWSLPAYTCCFYSRLHAVLTTCIGIMPRCAQKSVPSKRAAMRCTLKRPIRRLGPHTLIHVTDASKASPSKLWCLSLCFSFTLRKLSKKWSAMTKITVNFICKMNFSQYFLGISSWI